MGIASSLSRDHVVSKVINAHQRKVWIRVGRVDDIDVPLQIDWHALRRRQCEVHQFGSVGRNKAVADVAGIGIEVKRAVHSTRGLFQRMGRRRRAVVVAVANVIGAIAARDVHGAVGHGRRRAGEGVGAQQRKGLWAQADNARCCSGRVAHHDIGQDAYEQSAVVASDNAAGLRFWQLQARGAGARGAQPAVLEA